MSKRADALQEAKRMEARRRAEAYAAGLSPEEDARIAAAAAADPDEVSIEGRQAMSHADYLVWRRKHGVRGPQKAPTKKLVSIRLDPDVLEHFRATGDGWQGRINEALRKAAGLGRRAG